MSFTIQKRTPTMSKQLKTKTLRNPISGPNSRVTLVHKNIQSKNRYSVHGYCHGPVLMYELFMKT